MGWEKRKCVLMILFHFCLFRQESRIQSSSPFKIRNMGVLETSGTRNFGHFSIYRMSHALIYLLRNLCRTLLHGTCVMRWVRGSEDIKSNLGWKDEWASPLFSARLLGKIFPRNFCVIRREYPPIICSLNSSATQLGSTKLAVNFPQNHLQQCVWWQKNT